MLYGLFFWLAALAFGQAENSAYIKFITPHPDTAIDKNIVKIAVAVSAGKDTVHKVLFYVRYAKYSTRRVAQPFEDLLIAADSVPPFEALWDCSQILDQDNVTFYCKLFNNQGQLIQLSNKESESKSTRLTTTLDRNEKLLNKEFISYYTRRPVKIDGILDEWFAKDSVVFTTNDNRIIASSKWDRENLYCAARVFDPNVFPLVSDAHSDSLSVYVKDGVEFFLDLDHTHTVFRNQRDYQVTIAADGRFSTSIWLFLKDGQEKKNTLPFNPLVKVRKTGFGYEVETAFKWTELRLTPASGLTMGFNLVNLDRKDLNGVMTVESWAGISSMLNHNPSEWGNLRLAVRRTNLFIILGVMSVLLLILLLAILYVKKRKEKEQLLEVSVTSQQRIVETVKTYIEQNIGDENLGLKQAAAQVGLSPDYLRKLFKKTTAENFPDYINRIRIAKSKELLANTFKQITEIAYESGFGTYQNFNRVFKNSEGMTPTDYRKQYFKK